jgi:CheY-like chemotaxis protein
MPSLRKILIVDDESPAIELFRSYLAGLRFEMEAETRPELALARALAFRPHLILIDVMMPAMDGWELLQRLRHAPALRDVPIIACSVLNDGELARSLGATQFLRKPILRHQLITVVQAALSDG